MGDDVNGPLAHRDHPQTQRAPSSPLRWSASPPGKWCCTSFRRRELDAYLIRALRRPRHSERALASHWGRPPAWEAAMIAWRALQLTLIVFVLLCIVMTLMAVLLGTGHPETTFSGLPFD